jgi:hypothetical protein
VFYIETFSVFSGLGDLGFLGFLRSFFFDDIAADGVFVVVSARRGRGLAFYYLLSPSSQVIKNAPSPSPGLSYNSFNVFVRFCLYMFSSQQKQTKK